MPHDLFLTTRQTTRIIINAFANNISTHIKLSKAQISTIIQSNRSFGKFRKESTNKHIAISLARNNLPGLVTNLTSNAINKFERKISEKGAVWAGKGFTLYVLKENMKDNIEVKTSLEDCINWLTYRNSKKNKIEKQEGGFLAALLAPLAGSLVPLAASLVQPAISLVVKGISGRGVWRAGAGYMFKKF